MSEETRRKAIAAWLAVFDTDVGTLTSRAGDIVDALSDLMREIAREEAQDIVDSESMRIYLAERHAEVSDGVMFANPPKSAVPTPAAGEWDTGKGRLNTQAAPEPVRCHYSEVPTRIRCFLDLGHDGRHLYEATPESLEANVGAKGPPETIWLVWDTECRGWVEAIQQSGADKSSHGYIRADVAAKEAAHVAEAVEQRSDIILEACSVLGAQGRESLPDAARRVVSERLASERGRLEACALADQRASTMLAQQEAIATEKARADRAEASLAKADNCISKQAKALDRAEARVKELEGMREGDEAELSVIIQQRDKLEQELTAANLAIESARKTLWSVKP